MNATSRDELRLAQYSARKAEAYEGLLEECEECIEVLETEAKIRLMTEEKHRLSKKIESLEHYYRKHLSAS